MNQKVKEKATKTKLNAVRQNYGRPSDDHLESFFMHRLRDGKLQMINAESEAEYFCGQCNDSAENKDLSKQKTLKVREIFKNKLGTAQQEILWNVFREGVEKWEYKEIRSQKDFPKYLFLDELDLSYILHYFLTCSIPQVHERTELTNPELLYYCLLTFSCRDMISLRVVEGIENSYDQIINSMRGIKQRIVVQYHREYQPDLPIEINRIEEESRSEEEEREEDRIDSELRKGEIYREIEEIERNLQEKVPKTKPIEKEKKVGKRPRGRPKSKKEEEEKIEPLNRQMFETILQKLATYIAWAYKYIYAQELAKTQRLNNQF